MKDFTNRVAVITGAGSGIGRELATQLASEQCHLALSDIDPAGLEETKRLCESHSVNVLMKVCDVAKLEDVENFRNAVKQEFGSVDLLFNNAGVGFRGEVAHSSYADYEWIMGINFWGVLHGCKEFMPIMSSGRTTHIINISSVYGLMAVPTQSAYNASKFAVRGFTESLYQELKGSSVNVSCVLPGGVRSNIVENSRSSDSSEDSAAFVEAQKSEFESLLRTTPQKAAETILSGVKRNRFRILVGADAKAIDRMVRHLPFWYTKVVGWTMQLSDYRLRRRVESHS